MEAREIGRSGGVGASTGRQRSRPIGRRRQPFDRQAARLRV